MAWQMHHRIPRISIRYTRTFQSAAIHKDLVGPPDPISHIRPVIYDDAPPSQSSDLRHPYSLREFTGDVREYQWKIQRQQVDAYNHDFWYDSNTRFEAAKQATLDALPETCNAEDREVALSEFYKQWAAQEYARQQTYTQEWRKQNWFNILLGSKLKYQAFWSRLFGEENNKQ